MDEEKRMADTYEIIQAIYVGNQEIVMGEDTKAVDKPMYMVAYCQTNEIFQQYTDVMGSNDYLEVVELFGQRIAEQAQRGLEEQNKAKAQGIDDSPIMPIECTPISYEDDLREKVIVIKPDILRREYRRATCQLKLCTGGFGASPNSRGRAVFCTDLYTGRKTRFDRQDILGTMDRANLPQWAVECLNKVEQEQKMQRHGKEER